MNVEPRIVKKQFLLAGVESAPIDFQTDFGSVLEGLHQRVRDGLDAVYGSVAEPVRMVGFWQPGGVYFAGVELMLDVKAAPEGWAVKRLPESVYAAFDEQKRGTMGGPQGGAYQWLLGSPMFTHNGAIAGDFEVYKNMTDTASDCGAEILIPIKVKDTFRDISEAKAFQKGIEIFVMPPSRVIGKELIVPSNVENPIPAFCGKLMQTDDWKTLHALPRVIPESGFGWTCDWVEATKSFSYLCSELTPAGTPVPEGFQFRDVPQTLAAVGKFGGATSEIGDIAEYLRSVGFEPAYQDAGCGWNAELYLEAEEKNPPPNGNTIGWRWVVPCRKAGEKQAEKRTSNKIENIRKIQPSENYFLASAVCSVAKSLGAEREDYHFYSAFTGDMFAYLYSENPGKPCPSDSGVTSCFYDAEAVRRAFAAFGHGCVYFSNADIKRDFRGVMDAIRASVDKGIPVVAWGMGNVASRNEGRYDTLPEGCLIGGYDGDVLLVNLYMGPGRLPEGSVDEHGYSRIVNGLDTCPGVFVAGEKIAAHDMRPVCEGAVAQIPALLRREASDGDFGGRYVFGKAAFELWAKTLETEVYFEGKTDEELGGAWWNLHGSPYCCVCTSAADEFMKELSERCPDWTLVAKLAPLYNKMRWHRQEIWDLQGGFYPPMEKFREREFRAQIAAVLRRMGGVCDEILEVFGEVEK